MIKSCQSHINKHQKIDNFFELLKSWKHRHLHTKEKEKRLSRTYGDNKILYFVGWVRRGDTFDDKLITFAPRRNPPEDYL
jgi:hypothetical protein